nr:MAG TPA: hypothetical protein [Caudoviricetes sp.]
MAFGDLITPCAIDSKKPAILGMARATVFSLQFLKLKNSG